MSEVPEDIGTSAHQNKWRPRVCRRHGRTGFGTYILFVICLQDQKNFTTQPVKGSIALLPSAIT